jgi:SAM-dependent methyltransferase
MKSKYFYERHCPQVGEAHYLCLSDLKIALNLFSSEKNINVLDYGSGSSPYRSLFPNSNYLRADLKSSNLVDSDSLDIDFYLDTSSKCPCSDKSFDLILSTQVLEHVKDPTIYINECHRMLKDEGRLILTTHGTFPDHACPNDYYRWTLEGLVYLLEAEGFSIKSKIKITTNQRALLYFFQQFLPTLSTSRKSLRGLFFWFLKKSILGNLSNFHKFTDFHYSNCRVVINDFDKHPFYICILIEARK